MAVQVITLRKNDTAPNLPITCRRISGSVIDITGATVNFIIANSGGSRTNTGHTACTPVSATAGTCTYDLVTGDIPAAGEYTGDVEITYSNNEVETQTQSVVIIVLEKY